MVILACPVLQPFRVRHSASSSGPAARWMAPSTPPPPSRLSLAALTMTSTFMVVISFRTICRGMTAPPRVLVLSYHRWAYLAIRPSRKGGFLIPSASLPTRNILCRRKIIPCQTAFLSFQSFLSISVTRNDRHAFPHVQTAILCLCRAFSTPLSVAFRPIITS